MSYFDTTVFNRITQQQKETNDLLRELIKTLQEQKPKCRYPTQNFEPPMQAQQPEGDVVAYLDVGANGYLDLEGVRTLGRCSAAVVRRAARPGHCLNHQ